MKSILDCDTESCLPRFCCCAERKISELSEDELLIGTFPSADAAIAAAHQQASFKSLLVARCQFEFEKTARAANQSQ